VFHSNEDGDQRLDPSEEKIETLKEEEGK